jgi:prolyl oligopeptidase
MFRKSGMLVLMSLIVGGAWAEPIAVPKPPQTRTDNVKDTLHGTELVDPYRWLEDQQAKETRDWIAAQNTYTDGILGRVAGRDQLKKRITELTKIDTIGTPREHGGRYFFSKRRADQNLSVMYMREGLHGDDRVLIDPHGLSSDHTVSVNLLDVSNDGKLLAYGIRQGGEDEIAMRFMDIDSRKPLPDQFPKARYWGASIKPDKSGLYYTKYDNKSGPRVYYHAMGQDVASDVELFGKGYGPGVLTAASLSEDGRYLLIQVMYGSAAMKTELYVQNLSKGGPITPIINDIDARFSGDIAGDTLFIQTNWKAPNSRVFAADLNQPTREKWKEIIPEGKSVLQSISPVGGKLFATYLENVTSRVKIFAPDGKYEKDLTLPGVGTTGGVSGWWDKSEGFYSFSSFHVPSTIHHYDVATGKTETWAKIHVPVNTDDFEVKQVWYESKDKTKVPMFLMHKKGLKLDGSNPTFLTGYGGFNLSRTPGFSSLAALWVEQGGVYALPNLRGGGEFGEAWHQSGMLDKKQNVFDDFIAAAEYLIKEGYTSSPKLVISGGSNGGLLVGAALTQRPELFRAVVCSVPLLDMVRYHKFLVARFWVPEYGSAENADQFRYIHAYSPYHQVKPGTKYPAVLFISGDADTRVDPLHARKMCALLQASTGSDRPVLLHYDTKGGHSGGKPVTKIIDDLTDEFAFLAWQLEMTIK